MSNDIKSLILELKKIQDEFSKKFGVKDIYSNSKVFEILIANELEHTLIPGHSGSRDARDEEGEYEYKHFKETSSNHSWTFNDYSNTVIKKLKNVKAVIFAHIDDTKGMPRFDWYYFVQGDVCSRYLKFRTLDLLKRMPKGIPNKRKMINFSPIQLERDLKVKKISVEKININGKYYPWLIRLNKISIKIEKITGISQILTSNKIWEFLVSLKLDGHNVLSEQVGHDAKDEEGNYYEYKVSKNFSWNFQDISNEVLKKYENDKSIILAIVDKENMKVIKIFEAEPKSVIRRLKEKLEEKHERYKSKGGLRRLQVSLSKGDLDKIGARSIFPSRQKVLNRTAN